MKIASRKFAGAPMRFFTALTTACLLLAGCMPDITVPNTPVPNTAKPNAVNTAALRALNADPETSQALRLAQLGGGLGNELLPKINAFRLENGVAPIKPHHLLYKAAQEHAVQMKDNKSITQSGPASEKILHSLRALGYPACQVGVFLGESRHSTFSNLKIWTDKEDSRKSLLDPNLKTYGFGYDDRFRAVVLARSDC
jgi:uncharacterized protein YkwD